MLGLLRGCGGIGIRARLRGVWLCLASSSLAIRITIHYSQDINPNPYRGDSDELSGPEGFGP